MEQQALINRICELASAISLTEKFFVDVRYDGILNQLTVRVIHSNARTEKSVDAIDLFYPNDHEVAKARVHQNLMRVVTHLESLQARSLQRSLQL